MVATLLLVGRDGNGKSSTGNSILGVRVQAEFKYFEPRSSSQSGSGEVLSGRSVIDDKEILVVDGPDIGETNINDPDDVNFTLQRVKSAIDLCLTGFTALVVVFKYGSRFTQQEKDTVSLIRSIFGESVFTDYGIIVMTHGDNFNLDHEDEPMPFETWCSRQTKYLNNLITECRNRCVLFDNRAEDDRSLRIQRNVLLTKVAQIHARIGPYTWSDYMKAENGRKVITVSGKKAALEVETKKVLDEITERQGRIYVYNSPDMAIEKISEMQRMIDNHKRRLETEAENTDLMNDLLVQVRVMESRLETKAHIANLEIEMREHSGAEALRQNDSFRIDRQECRQEDGFWWVVWRFVKEMTRFCVHQCYVYLCQCLRQDIRRIFS